MWWSEKLKYFGSVEIDRNRIILVDRTKLPGCRTTNSNLRFTNRRWLLMQAVTVTQSPCHLQIFAHLFGFDLIWFLIFRIKQSVNESKRKSDNVWSGWEWHTRTSKVALNASLRTPFWSTAKNRLNDSLNIGAANKSVCTAIPFVCLIKVSISRKPNWSNDAAKISTACPLATAFCATSS